MWSVIVRPLSDCTLARLVYTQAIAAILASPAQHDGKTYNLVGERQMGNMIVSKVSRGVCRSVACCKVHFVLGVHD